MTKKLIGLYQLISGVFGLIFITFSAISGSVALQGKNILLPVVVGVLLSGLMAWSGYALLNNLKKARQYSMFLQAVQVPFIAFSGFFFKFSLANFLYVGWINGSLDYRVSVSVVDFGISTNAAGHSIAMVCVLPIILLIGLIRMKP